jgi:hypothetical protein
VAGLAVIGEDDDRAMKCFFQSPGNQSDHSLVPLGVMQDKADAISGIALLLQNGCRLDCCLIPGIGLDASSLPVQVIKLLCQFARTIDVVFDQATYAKTHVTQPTCRVDAWSDGKSEV